MRLSCIILLKCYFYIVLTWVSTGNIMANLIDDECIFKKWEAFFVYFAHVQWVVSNNIVKILYKKN